MKLKRMFKLTLLCLLVFVSISNPFKVQAETKYFFFDKGNLTLFEKETVTIKVTTNYKIKADQFKWSSSDKKVATVNSKGKVTAVKEGKATITVKAPNGLTTTTKVTVRNKAKWTKNHPNYATVTVKGKTVKIGMTLAELKKELGEPDRVGQNKYSNITSYTWKDENYDYYILAHMHNIDNKAFTLVVSGPDMTSSFGVTYKQSYKKANELIEKNINFMKGYTHIGTMSEFSRSYIVAIKLYDSELNTISKYKNQKVLNTEKANTEYSMQAVDLVNLYLKKNGYPLAVYKEGARKIAEYRTELTKKYDKPLVHNVPKGELDNETWYEQSKYSADGSHYLSELYISKSSAQADELIGGWASSPSHYPYIAYEKDSYYEYLSVGIASNGKYGSYLTSILGPDIVEDPWSAEDEDERDRLLALEMAEDDYWDY